jgi:hypothetical protein
MSGVKPEAKKKKQLYLKIPITFLTHPNFLVLFRTGKDSHPSNLDSINKHRYEDKCSDSP